MTKLAKLKKEAVDWAIKIKLKNTPRCEGCGLIAITAHHLIRQKNSNYARCLQENLFSVCSVCHCLAHSRGDMVVLGHAILKRGKKWHNKLIKDAQKIIKDNQGYWIKKIEEQKAIYEKQ